ncbi:MAG: SprT family zinc-dependent metalloprotease [Acidobacteria bacterium]|nr:SprT family zinc-dependent metalloprotease [Acidobacteriota bacterium]
MNTEQRHITVNGLRVQIVRKDIKNLHLGVYPPNGRVRVAAPLRVGDGAVRLAVIGKLGWVKRQQAGFKAQQRQSEREMVSGESHYFLGQRYRLRVVHHDGAAKVLVRNKSALELHVRPATDTKQRERVLQRWYRQQLKELIPPLLEKWQPALGVQAAECRIKKMKTKWGACNTDARRVWLNLELAKKPVRCLEYLVVHELVHLIERHHNDRFISLMDKHLRQWRLYRQELNSAPLAHETWSY